MVGHYVNHSIVHCPMAASDVHGSSILDVQPRELIDACIGKRVSIHTRHHIIYTGIMEGIDKFYSIIMKDVVTTAPRIPEFQSETYPRLLLSGTKVILIVLPQELIPQ